MFETRLAVKHLSAQRWELTDPLVWEGRQELFVIRSGFETDFASIPKPLRWLLDNAGANSEAAVLHDAAWRESQRETPRIDPSDADGMLRRALRETGATALTRGLMWFGVRLAAIVRGRYGRRGPGKIVKIVQLVGMLVLGVLTALAPTVATLVGLVVFWIANWIVALVWRAFERSRFPGFAGNWPWWPRRKSSTRKGPLPREFLIVLPLESEKAKNIRATITDSRIDDAAIDTVMANA